MPLRLYVFITLVLATCACTQPKQLPIPKSIDSEQVERFSISGANDTTLVTADEIIIHIPQGAVVDGDGNAVTDYELQFAGFMDAADALASNITTTTNDELLQSSAIIYAQVSHEGEVLFIDPDKGLLINVPDYYQQNNLEVYTKKSEEVPWQKSQEPVYLSTLDFDLLDFLPDGFRATAKEMLKTAYSDEAADSLYYTMEALERREVISVISNGAERSEVFIWPKGLEHPMERELAEFLHRPVPAHRSNVDTTAFVPNITPAKIKVLKTAKFANSFIATRAFEQRMALLQELDCWNLEFLNTYLQNLHQPLWVSDSIIFFHLKFDDPSLDRFKEFYEQKLSNTPGAPTSSHELFDWFNAQLAKERKEIAHQQKNAFEKNMAPKRLAKLVVQMEKAQAQRTHLLKKRGAYRMKRFGFKLIKTGWYNYATKNSKIKSRPIKEWVNRRTNTKLKDLEKFELSVTLANGKSYDRTYAYIVNPKIFSLYALSSENRVLFDRGFGDDEHLLLWGGQPVMAVGVGKNGKEWGYQLTEFKQTKINKITLTLKSKSYQSLKQTLKKLPLKKRENKVWADIELAEKIAKQDSTLWAELDLIKGDQEALMNVFLASNSCLNTEWLR